MNRTVHKLCAWSGTLCLALMVVGFILLAGFIPARSARQSAQQTAQFLLANRDMIKWGLIVAMFAASLLMPFAASNPYAADRGPMPRRHIRGPAHLHDATRCRRADQRIQLPGLGDARKAGPGLSGRSAVDRQTRTSDRLPDRAGVPRNHRFRATARGLRAIGVRQPPRPARPP